MEPIQVFNRVEQKYLLSKQEAQEFYNQAKEFLQPDLYPRYTLRNLYLDSKDDIMAIRSLEKPTYKEKLRLRSYGIPEQGDPLFLEVKKKYDGIVNKRRIQIDYAEMNQWLRGIPFEKEKGQIGNEMNYFHTQYHPEVKAFIAYDREAWQGVQDADLRITFDTNIRYRTAHMNFMDEKDIPLLGKDDVLLEIKIQDAYPIWLAHLLTSLKVKQSSFSKYGTVYRNQHDQTNIKTQHIQVKEELLCFKPFLPAHLVG